MNEPETQFLEQTGNLAVAAGLLMTAGRKASVGLPTGRADYLPFGRPDFGDQEIAEVTRVLRSGWVGMGPETITFEQELADACGAPHVVTVNSCTSALFLALFGHPLSPAGSNCDDGLSPVWESFRL